MRCVSFFTSGYGGSDGGLLTSSVAIENFVEADEESPKASTVTSPTQALKMQTSVSKIFQEKCFDMGDTCKDLRIEFKGR